MSKLRGRAGVLRFVATAGAVVALGVACGGPLPGGRPCRTAGGTTWRARRARRRRRGTTRASPPDDATAAAAGRGDAAPPDVPVGRPQRGVRRAPLHRPHPAAAATPAAGSATGRATARATAVLPRRGASTTRRTAAPPPVCGGECDAHRYGARSCGAGDPWRLSATAGPATPVTPARRWPGPDLLDDSADRGPAEDGLTYGMTSVYGDGLDALGRRRRGVRTSPASATASCSTTAARRPPTRGPTSGATTSTPCCTTRAISARLRPGADDRRLPDAWTRSGRAASASADHDPGDLRPDARPIRLGRRLRRHRRDRAGLHERHRHGRSPASTTTWSTR
ncbi:MAG: hypothetical protein MZV70_00325 [Desulfobacterales bacterium]|nr:hypothetical protein [Desulfobacterales bacterium]